MADTTTSLEEMVSEHTNHAAPHMFQENVVSRMPVRPINTRPGGSNCASIADMALYFHLDPIADRGGPRLSADAATQLTAPLMYVRRSDFFEIGDVHYGLGFEVAHYRGERLIVHGGAWGGYPCGLRMLRDRGFGVVVSTNLYWRSGCPVISHAILDRLLRLDPLPWFGRLSGPAAALRAQRRKEIAGRTATIWMGARPSHDDYAGEYEHPAYGVVRIVSNDARLRCRGLGLDLPISHRHYDLFERPHQEQCERRRRSDNRGRRGPRGTLASTL
jgi:hypothetical protein